LRFRFIYSFVKHSAGQHTYSPEAFRELCHKHGLAATHQRAVIFQALASLPGHPNPEEVYEKVRRQVPSMSLATVYKTFHAFLEAGIVHEINLHRGALRVDPNPEPHHHLICTACRAVEDLEESAVAPVKLKGSLPEGFVVERFALEVHGLCRRCASKRKQS
jgi:Fur family transcriptional regulator, peroxide stress response regulator